MRLNPTRSGLLGRHPEQRRDPTQPSSVIRRHSGNKEKYTKMEILHFCFAHHTWYERTTSGVSLTSATWERVVTSMCQVYAAPPHTKGLDFERTSLGHDSLSLWSSLYLVSITRDALGSMHAMPSLTFPDDVPNSIT